MSPPLTSRGSISQAVSIGFNALSILIVTLRFLTRSFIVGNVGIEDWTIGIATVAAIALAALVAIEVRASGGNHTWELTDAEIRKSLETFYWSFIVYIWALGFIKCSLLLQYHRIFSMPRVRLITLILGVFVVLWMLVMSFAHVFTCLPIHAFWDDRVSGSCVNRLALWLTNAGVTIATDIAILVLPMPVLHRLRLPTKQKRALLIVFSIGGFACLTSILRLHRLSQSQEGDITYNSLPAVTWSNLEVNIGIICASLPSLRIAISHFFPKIFPHSLHQGTNLRLGPRLSRYEFGKSLRTAKGQEVDVTILGGRGNNDDAISVINRNDGNNKDIKVVTVLKQTIERQTSEEIFSRERNLSEGRYALDGRKRGDRRSSDSEIGLV